MNLGGIARGVSGRGPGVPGVGSEGKPLPERCFIVENGLNG